MEGQKEQATLIKKKRTNARKKSKALEQLRYERSGYRETAGDAVWK